MHKSNRCPHSFLQNTSTRRHKCLESLQDFLQSATQELMWLNEREDLEISRDWSSPDADMEQTDSAYKVRHELSIKLSGKRRYLYMYQVIGILMVKEGIIMVREGIIMVKEGHPSFFLITGFSFRKRSKKIWGVI